MPQKENIISETFQVWGTIRGNCKKIKMIFTRTVMMLEGFLMQMQLSSI